MGRTARQAVTTNPQKSADAIVVNALKLVGGDEGQNLTTRARLYLPDERRKAENIRELPRKNSSESERYEEVPTLIGIVGDELVEVQLSSDRMLATLTEHINKLRLTRGAVESTEWKWSNCCHICGNTRKK